MNKINKMTNQKSKKIALVAGGTGGHIFPAISLGEWIVKHDPNASVIFFCGNRQLEGNIYCSHGITPIVLPVKGSPFSGSLKQKIARTVNIVRAFFNAFAYLREESPDFILFFGGYISFPVYLAAKLRSLPVAIHEQNACAGKVTRFLAKFNELIFTGFKACWPLDSGKTVYTGIPIREFNLLPKNMAMEELGLSCKISSNSKIVLVLTGSLGSETIKTKLLSLVSGGNFSDVQFVMPATSEKVEKVRHNIWLLPRVWKAELLFSIADAIIARAGGSSLAEIGALKIPAIIIPWKDAKDNHQYYNAREFVQEHSALLLDEDDVQGKLEIMLNQVLYDTNWMSSHTKQDNASFKIYNKMLSMVNEQ